VTGEGVLGNTPVPEPVEGRVPRAHFDKLSDRERYGRVDESAKDAVDAPGREENSARFSAEHQGFGRLVAHRVSTGVANIG
jgi:hypothetical protein